MDTWTLRADHPADQPLYLSNGYMGVALGPTGGIRLGEPPAATYIRGIYNDTGDGGIDRLALVPCWCDLAYGAQTELVDYRRELDLRRAEARSRLVLREERGLVTIDQTVFLSRADPYQGAMQITVVPDFDGEIELRSELRQPSDGRSHIVDQDIAADGLRLTLCTDKYGVEVSTCVSFDDAGWTSEASSGRGWVCRVFRCMGRRGVGVRLTQMARVCTSLEAERPVEVAMRPSPGFGAARAAHGSAWDELWRAGIDVDGDPESERFAHAALYYLWSSIRPDDRWSIAPMGLSSNGYNGHIFWDTEMWMYPSLLLTHPDLARSCLTYRENTIGAARARASAEGYSGVRYPWESAFTGEEMTPHWAEPRELQIHITADVAIAHWWYFLSTGDREWLRDHGYPVMRECARFWESRVRYHAELDRYEIDDVQCADEYAVHVNNDAFTNAAARLCLQMTAWAAELIGERAEPAWLTIAESMYVPYDPGTGRHLEFDGYDGRVIKQADVELLAYPLEHVTDEEQIRRDLDFYATVMDPEGPAMSYCVHSVVSAQLGRADEAYALMKRSYEPNVREPFQAFSETPTNDQFHFCTGMGGTLQTFLFGWTGLRLRRDHFVLRPVLPACWQRLQLRGLALPGGRTDIEIDRAGFTLCREVAQRGRLIVRVEHRGRVPEVHARWDDVDGGPLDVSLQPENQGAETPSPSTNAGPADELARRIRVTLGGETLLDVAVRAPAHAAGSADAVADAGVQSD